jgi:hypothetical protein
MYLVKALRKSPTLDKNPIIKETDIAISSMYVTRIGNKYENNTRDEFFNPSSRNSMAKTGQEFY